MADIQDVAVGAGSAAAGAAAYHAWRRHSERDILDGKPVRLQRFDPREIKVDADTFQFKSGGDDAGVTDRLKGVTKWNPAAAGKAIVYERADGERFIADGHQRRGLGVRLANEGQRVRLDAYVLRQADGWTPNDVRAYAAIKNMHESSGNALDMAKVLRDRPDLATGSLPVTDGKIREAKALANLSPDAFKMVTGGAVRPEHAAAVGESVKDTTRHADMLTEMQKAKVASAKAEKARTKAWKDMQAGRIDSVRYNEIARDWQSKKDALSSMQEKGSGLRGTQNAANMEAIIANRQANADPKPAKPRKSKAKPAPQPDAAIKSAAKDAGVRLPDMTNEKPVRKTAYQKSLEAGPRAPEYSGEPDATGKPTSKSRNQLIAEAKKAGIKGAAKMETRALGKKLGYSMKYALPIGIAAGALIAMNRSAEAGESKSQQVAAGATTAATGVAVGGAFIGGAALAVRGLMKTGMTAAKAIPGVNLAMMAGGAIHGAATAAPGERLAAAARGAWDMSLPGGLVNTGLVIKEAIDTSRARVRSAGPTRITTEQAEQFAAQSDQYTPRPLEDSKSPNGWSNAARIAAYEARMKRSGKAAANAPYGGVSTNGPSQWARGATTAEAMSKSKPRN